MQKLKPDSDHDSLLRQVKDTKPLDAHDARPLDANEQSKFDDIANNFDAPEPLQQSHPSTGAGVDQAEAFANDPANHRPSGSSSPSSSQGGPSHGLKGADSQGSKASAAQAALKRATNATKNVDGATKNAAGAAGGLAAGATAATGAGKAAGTAGGLAGGLSKAAGTISSFGRKFSLKTKDGRMRSGIAGFILTLGVIAALITSFLSIPLKLLHVANVLREAAFGGSDHTEDHAAYATFRRIMGWHLKDNGGRASNTGRPWKDRAVNLRIDKLNGLLEKEGLRFRFEKPTRLGVPGRLIGIESTRTGALVEDYRDRSFMDRRTVAKDTALRLLAGENLGAIRHVLYTSTMRLHSGVSFKFWTTEKAQNLKKMLVAKVRGGIASEAVSESGPREGTRDPNRQYSGDDKIAAAKDASDSAKAALDKFAETNDAVEAKKAGMASFRAKALKLFGWTGLAVFYCIIQEMVEEAENQGYAQRMQFLMREGNMILTMADQMIAATSGGGFKLGTSDENSRIDIDQFGEMMERFDGVDSADPKTDEDAKEFTQAAAWRRATDEPVSTAHSTEKEFISYTPDLDPAANPDTTQLKGVLGAIAAVFQIPGTGPVCAVLTSWFGWVLIGAEVAINIWDGEALALAGKAATIAAFYLLQPHVQSLLNAATNLGVTGTENSVGTVNNGDAGLNLSAKDHSRMLGDRVATDAEVGEHRAAARAQQDAIARSKGWTYRLFALENTRSLASRILAKTPTSPRRLIATVRHNILAFPRNFGAVFFPAQFAMAGEPAAAYKDPYGFRGMVTTDAEIDNIDPDAAEEFLLQKVGDGKTRLEMLGDPNTYTPNNGETGNKENLLHCFVDKWRLPDDEDEICLDLGILTKQGNENPKNPGKEQIIDKIYCDVHDVCDLPWTHTLPKYCDSDPEQVCGQSTPTTDFEIFRMYLKYTMAARAYEGFTTEADPFAGTGVPVSPGGPAVALGEMCKVGPGGAAVPPADCAAYWAAKLLANPNIIKGNAVVTEDLTRAVNKQPTRNGSTVCAKAGGDGNAWLHPQLLYALEQTATAGGFKITIWNMISGHDCDQYNHPHGRATDIGAINGVATDTTGGKPGTHNRAFAEYIAKFLPDGGEILQANQPNCRWTATLPSYISNGRSNDNCNHIHVSVGSKVKF